MEAIDSAEWALAKSPETYRNFVHLLNQTLAEQQYHGLRRHHKRHYFYFRSTDGLVERRLSTEVEERPGCFRAYPDGNDPANARHFRHHALEHQFVRLDGRWFLELNPTYHFTSDGFRNLPWAAQLVKGIKRSEERGGSWRARRHVGGTSERSDDLFCNRDDSPIRFGMLETFDVDRGVDDRAWKRPQDVSKPTDVATLFEAS